MSVLPPQFLTMKDQFSILSPTFADFRLNSILTTLIQWLKNRWISPKLDDDDVMDLLVHNSVCVLTVEETSSGLSTWSVMSEPVGYPNPNIPKIQIFQLEKRMNIGNSSLICTTFEPLLHQLFIHLLLSYIISYRIVSHCKLLIYILYETKQTQRKSHMSAIVDRLIRGGIS